MGTTRPWKGPCADPGSMAGSWAAVSEGSKHSPENPLEGSLVLMPALHAGLSEIAWQLSQAIAPATIDCSRVATCMWDLMA